MNKRARIFRRRSKIIMNIAESENIENLSPCSKTLNEQVKSLKDKIAGLEAKLDEYGGHTQQCALNFHPLNTQCTCGWKN